MSYNPKTNFFVLGKFKVSITTMLTVCILQAELALKEHIAALPKASGNPNFRPTGQKLENALEGNFKTPKASGYNNQYVQEKVKKENIDNFTIMCSLMSR